MWASAILHVCLAAAPIAGAQAVRIVERDQLYTYEPTPDAARRTREALDRLAGGVVTTPDRRVEWDNQIAAALMAHDVAAARGLMLSARAILDPEGRGAISREAGVAPSDAELETAALALLTPGTRGRYVSNVPLLSRQTSPEARLRQRRPVVVAGDSVDFETATVSDLSNPSTDHVRFLTLSLPIVRAGAMADHTAIGASVLRAALEDGRVPAALHAELAALAEMALPRQRFSDEAARRAAADPQLDRAATLGAAYRAALTPDGLMRFETELARIGAIATQTGAAACVNLLMHARGIGDLKRLELIAATNPDRGAAVARFLTPNGALPSAGRGALDITPAFAVPATLASLAMLLIGFTALATAVQAIAHALERVGIVRVETEAPRVKRGAKLLREFQR